VISRLEKVNAIANHAVDEAMLLRDAAAPATGQDKSQWLRLADAHKRVGQHGFNQFKRAKSGPAIGLDPVGKVFAEFWQKVD
jgi:hypothetical protein